MGHLPDSFNHYIENGCMRCKYGATPDCKVNSWRKEILLLREIIQQTELEESIKWGVPCYILKDKNVLNISALKSAACIGFFKGALIESQSTLLEAPGENSQAVRLIKFTSTKEIKDNAKEILRLINLAIAIEKEGKKVDFKKESEPIPEELMQAFENNPAFKTAFYKLTPGRQRGYLLHFNQAKQAATRVKRIERYTVKILDGLGFHD
ncbi:YdeI/OmpD-associated family protein [Luteibaculum oceani]|uniref:YdhG-like domain-containing protein n=1 Tax=Luteibaculum oceani TaxID=1294296 RepID=A0A5C6V9F6_9FLAO|nr:YdeI/OmpD-associated family protein [Luteibaculum oceani]TXC82113.1 hypothetical protein FRX97_03190 [Luteibaculum oceani]